MAYLEFVIGIVVAEINDIGSLYFQLSEIESSLTPTRDLLRLMVLQVVSCKAGDRVEPQLMPFPGTHRQVRLIHLSSLMISNRKYPIE